MTPDPLHESGSPQQREFTRVPVTLRAEVLLASGQVSGSATEISMKGLFVHCAARPAVGEDCTLTLHLGDTEEAIETQGHVVGQSDQGFAVQFDKILGLTSYEHLHNLVLYNARDTDKIESEFQTHLGLRRRD